MKYKTKNLSHYFRQLATIFFALELVSLLSILYLYLANPTSADTTIGGYIFFITIASLLYLIPLFPTSILFFKLDFGKRYEENFLFLFATTSLFQVWSIFEVEYIKFQPSSLNLWNYLIQKLLHIISNPLESFFTFLIIKSIEYFLLLVLCSIIWVYIFRMKPSITTIKKKKQREKK